MCGNDNRDPKVFWYAPGNNWVMLLWIDGNEYRFFTSTNLKSWTQTSSFTFPDVIEVPDIFELPLDGNAGNKKWIFWGGAGNYYIGTFDGSAFTAQSGPFSIRGGNCFAATQTFNDIPGDARRILIVHGTAQYPGMPFNNQMNFPVEFRCEQHRPAHACMPTRWPNWRCCAPDTEHLVRPIARLRQQHHGGRDGRGV